MKNSLTLSPFVKVSSPDLTGGQMQLLLKFYEQHPDELVTITVSVKGKPRSLNQNSYDHGVVIAMLSDETGHEPEELHEILKAKFLPRQFVSFGGERIQVGKSTTKLSTDEFEDYLERIRTFAAAELAMRIPLPNEAPIV